MSYLIVAALCAALAALVALFAIWLEAAVNTIWIMVLKPRAAWVVGAVAVLALMLTTVIVPANPQGPTLWLNIFLALLVTPLTAWPLSNLLAKWQNWSFVDLDSDRRLLGVLRFQIFDLVQAEQRVRYKPPHRPLRDALSNP